MRSGVDTVNPNSGVVVDTNFCDSDGGMGSMDNTFPAAKSMLPFCDAGVPSSLRSKYFSCCAARATAQHSMSGARGNYAKRPHLRLVAIQREETVTLAPAAVDAAFLEQAALMQHATAGHLCNSAHWEASTAHSSQPGDATRTAREGPMRCSRRSHSPLLPVSSGTMESTPRVVMNSSACPGSSTFFVLQT